MSKIRLHGVPLSGHTHKVEVFLRLLGLDFDYVDAPRDVRATEAFLRLNPLGQIPVLEDEGFALADSNAILVYLARRYDRSGRWLLEDPVGAAQVQRWLSISAGEVKYGPANARAMRLFGLKTDVDDAKAVAERLLRFMDQHLADREWLVGEAPTIADVACYPYVASAPEGGVDLDAFPAVRAWIGRFEALPGVKAMPRQPEAA